MDRTTYNISSMKHVNMQYLEVSRCRHAKQQQRNVQKKCAHYRNVPIEKRRPSKVCIFTIDVFEWARFCNVHVQIFFFFLLIKPIVFFFFAVLVAITA